MHLPRVATSLASLLGASKPALTPRQFEPDSSVYIDADTGLTFASYTSDRSIIFRVAIPDVIPADLIYDTVLQIVAPIDVGWAGFAWGGHMTYNPLGIAWTNDKEVVLSPRIAYGYYSPPIYTDSHYTVLKKGTHVNATHFQVTAKCTGCSSWGDDESTGISGNIDPEYQTTLAYAYGNTKVDTPADVQSTFGIHDSLGHPIYDLAVAKNKDFAEKVAALAAAGEAT
ncbi:iron reductase domain protein [Neurospora crassa]|uniref:Cellobiose dehydrogenase-like cytochrome domain-containing protein n=1 Tax=Neurospora crassa (strain ATCC 24698 / 74-OR23-1A / CBS 708.71 / DSM 1257 / FGSC 987) TaxID=367110 RepID=Q7S6W8_NEUCR|nr:hypothetical protein NCU05595 [Neurospora crassa OR74A]EAA31321.2 hypothetical protein NCU05595 [Neurospora crassa OR74A]KHE86750.1 iron reductase domain protein [Neurospora crassa]|eukprot:XP_960557.2 hypothetical protein NCU05595 [Neurospora crassa OR74A]